MRGGELVEAMAAAIDPLMNAHESLAGLDKAVKLILGTPGQFNGGDVTNYLEAYKATMLMWDISKER